MVGPFVQKSVHVMLELHEWKQVSFRRLEVPRDLHRNVPDAVSRDEYDCLLLSLQLHRTLCIALR